MEVLVVEDCSETYELIKRALVGHQLYHSESLKGARQILFEKNLDLVLLDVELPDGNGIDFCSELNTDPRFQSLPKIILTSHDQTEQKVFGLYSGADDYITKPFNFQELRARCEIRCNKRSQPKMETIGVFQFNSELQNLKIIKNNGEEELINLTPLEYRIIHLLATQGGKTLSRQEIVRKVWTENGTVIEARGIDTHISHIRSKLGEWGGCILSIYGKGYNFTAIPEEKKLAS